MMSLMLAAMLQAAPIPQDAGLIADPRWVRRPTGQDMARVFPDRAMRSELDGVSILVCGVTGEGRTSNCVIEHEEPAGMGFGDAAMRLARLFRMEPLDDRGAPVAGRTVRIPIRWRLPRN